MPPHPGLSPHAHALASHALVSSAPKTDHSTLDHNHRFVVPVSIALLATSKALSAKPILIISRPINDTFHSFRYHTSFLFGTVNFVKSSVKKFFRHRHKNLGFWPIIYKRSSFALTTQQSITWRQSYIWCIKGKREAHIRGEKKCHKLRGDTA